MKYYYDLHMHSALSPCGDNDMTPNNIVGMAALKGLSIIALTDHNTGENLPAIQKIAEEAGVLLIPGIEATTAEEIHVLTYFPEVEQAVEFGRVLYDSLPNIRNRTDIFGEQLILDEMDEETGSLEKLLIQATPYTIDDLVKMGREAGGFVLPAHVNKQANSMLQNLGFIPEELEFPALEVSARAPLTGIDLEKYRLIYSSDAHVLWDIAEKEHYLNLEECTRDAVFCKIFGKY